MDTTKAYELGRDHGKKMGAVLGYVAVTVEPVVKLAVLGFGVLILVGVVYPEVTEKRISS
jgi:hypothetical protein